MVDGEDVVAGSRTDPWGTPKVYEVKFDESEPIRRLQTAF